MAEFLKNAEYKKDLLKQIIKKLHRGESPEKLKEEFRQVLTNVSPLEIPLIEQELVKEGLRPIDIAKLCDLHVLLFREAVNQQDRELYNLPEGHPLKTLLEENEAILKDAEMLNLYASSLERVKDDPVAFKNILNTLKDLAFKIKNIGRTHYNREEIIIFPYIERRGLNAVASVLWRKHDENRAKIAKLIRILNSDEEKPRDQFAREVKELASEISTALVDMVFRENNILYPTLKALLSDGEWLAIKNQSKEVGYYGIEPPDGWNPDVREILPYEIKGSVEDVLNIMPERMRAELQKQGVAIKPDDFQWDFSDHIKLEHGYLNQEEIDAIFKHLPLDITFIDKNDRVKFFSGGDRLFFRSPSIIGRPVQLCHPPRSVHIVNKILKAFKSGERDHADFWIQMGGKFVYIRYFAVRNDKGEYIGTLEVTQEVSEIRNLKGEKRLLDWHKDRKPSGNKPADKFPEDSDAKPEIAQ